MGSEMCIRDSFKAGPVHGIFAEVAYQYDISGTRYSTYCDEIGFSDGISMESLNSFEISIVPRVLLETGGMLVLGRFGTW